MNHHLGAPGVSTLGMEGGGGWKGTPIFLQVFLPDPSGDCPVPSLAPIPRPPPTLQVGRRGESERGLTLESGFALTPVAV